MNFKNLSIVPVLALSLGACSTILVGEPPKSDKMFAAVERADDPLRRCLLAADVLEANPAAMTEADLQAGFDNIKANGQIQRLGPAFLTGYEGYSHKANGYDYFLRRQDPVRARLYRSFEAGQNLNKAETQEDAIKKVSPLKMAELGMLALDAGDPDCAVGIFNTVDEVTEANGASSVIGALFQDGKLRGYEQVMLSNYRALSYLMVGDENALPAARAARSVLEFQRDKYAEELEKVEQEKDEEAAKSEQYTTFVNDNVLSQIMEAEFVKTSQAEGERVRTPYLNPMSDYISALVAEIEATQDNDKIAEWDTARISLQNASDILPDNEFIKATLTKVTDYKNNGVPDGMKTVHVIAATGLAPRDKMISLNIPIDGNIFVFNVDKMSRVKTSTGPLYAEVAGQSADLALLSDVEGMALRWDKDRFTARVIKQGVIALAQYFVTKAASDAVAGKGDSIIKTITSAAFNVGATALTKPSTESWTSLPGKVFAARFEVPTSATSLKLAVRGPAGDISPVEFDLLPDSTTVIYARVVDNAIWGKATNIRFGEGKAKQSKRQITVEAPAATPVAASVSLSGAF